jgi:hypothetical protein
VVIPRGGPSTAPLRSSVIVLVLITLVFTAAALTLFVEKAGNDLLVEVRQADARRLRQEAFSALEVTLAVLEDFRQADNGLHSTAEGWGDPLKWAEWTPSEGRTVDVAFQDESGKIPLSHADLTTLTNLFEATGRWRPRTRRSSRTPSRAGWSRATSTRRGSPRLPGRADPLRRAAAADALLQRARGHRRRQGGVLRRERPAERNYWRFVNDCSLFNYPSPNANGANADVMAAVGQYTDVQQQHISDYLAGTGQYAKQGQQWFQNTTTARRVAGLGGNATPFGTTIAALRINITVHDGRSQYRVSVVVAPQGGATTNQTVATNAAAAATTASAATATTSVTSTAQPSSTATAPTPPPRPRKASIIPLRSSNWSKMMTFRNLRRPDHLTPEPEHVRLAP